MKETRQTQCDRGCEHNKHRIVTLIAMVLRSLKRHTEQHEPTTCYVCEDVKEQNDIQRHKAGHSTKCENRCDNGSSPTKNIRRGGVDEKHNDKKCLDPKVGGT